MDNDKRFSQLFGQRMQSNPLGIRSKARPGHRDVPNFTAEFLKPENTKEINEVANLMAEIFLQREPLTHALALSNPSLQETFRSFSMDVTVKVAQMGNICLAKNHEGRIIGFIMTAPSAKDAYPPIPPPGLEPWYDILEKLETAFSDQKLLNPALREPCNAVELVMGGVHEDFERQHIMAEVSYIWALTFYQHGVREAVAKATSISQEMFEGLGAQTLAQISYKDYEYNGTRPFASIQWPSAAKYMWGNIGELLENGNQRSVKL